jgi:uncharacterized lipoprotein
MKSIKTRLLLLTIPLITTLVLSACASAPSHLIISPDVTAIPEIKYDSKQATLNVTDMRTANHLVQILKEGDAASLFSAQERLEKIIKRSISVPWQTQGLTIQASAVNSINIAIEKAITSVTQETMSYQAQSEIILKVTINNGLQTLTSTFKNSGDSKGPFRADIAVLERNFNQRLTNLLQQILVNEEINQFLR